MNRPTLALLVVTLTLAGSFVYLTASKLSGLTALVDQMKVNEIALRESNQRLKQKNGMLEKQRMDSRRMVRKHRAAVVRQGVERAAKKMARAGVAMIPVVGISAVAAGTADDISDLCNDIRAARDLEKSLFGEEVPKSVEEERYCHEFIADELTLMANRERERIARDFGISYQSLLVQADKLKQRLGRIADELVNAPYQREFERQYRIIVDYWSGKLDELSDDPVTAPEDRFYQERASDPLMEGSSRSMQGA